MEGEGEEEEADDTPVATANAVGPVVVAAVAAGAAASVDVVGGNGRVLGLLSNARICFRTMDASASLASTHTT